MITIVGLGGSSSQGLPSTRKNNHVNVYRRPCRISWLLTVMTFTVVAAMLSLSLYRIHYKAVESGSGHFSPVQEALRAFVKARPVAVSLKMTASQNDTASAGLVDEQRSIRAHKSASPTRQKGSIHMIFSTSCSGFQNWQSYVFFYFAWKVQQPGTVTRIVTECTPQQQAALRQIHHDTIAVMSDRFHLHFAPTIQHKGTRSETKYFNKPFGVRYWMEQTKPGNNSIVILMDPDMMLTRPLTATYSSEDLWIKEQTHNESPYSIHVGHGAPIAQRYGYRDAWLEPLRLNLTYVVGEHNSPARNVTKEEADNYYSVGPPYVATAHDFRAIVHKWTDVTPRIYEKTHSFLSEMYGFSTAAAHVGLRPTPFRDLMISDPLAINEATGFLERVGKKDVCQMEASLIPPVVHYCQRAALGRWFIGKYKMPEDSIMSCDAPLLREPPLDLAIKYSYAIYPNGDRVDFHNDNSIKRNAFLLCHLIRAFNEAGEHYRENHCSTHANREKTYIFHTLENDSLIDALEERGDEHELLGNSSIET